MPALALISWGALRALLPLPLQEALARFPGTLPADDAPVLHHAGPLESDVLDLSTLVALMDTLPASAVTPSSASASAPAPAPSLLWVDGDLTLTHALLSAEWEGNAHLLVTGHLTTPQALLGPGGVVVGQDLRVRELLWGAGDTGLLQVQGQTQAAWALWDEGYATHLIQPPALGSCIDTRALPGTPGADPTGYHRERLAASLHPEGVNGLGQFTEGLTGVLRRDALAALARAGVPLLQPQEDALAPAAPAPDLCPNHAIDIANIQALVHSPLVARRAHRMQDWFGDVDYALCQRHVDADADQREDSVFITVHRRWDFYLQAEQVPEPRGIMGRIAARLGLQDPPMRTQLTRLYRTYDAQGQAAEWRPLDDAAPDAAWQACQTAWHATLAHVREGVAQARAGWPLWGAWQRTATPERVNALIQLPVFTEEFNDWWGERNGFWAGDTWVGARQATQRAGQHYGRALKLSWAAAPIAPGDDDDNHHASYLLEPGTDASGREGQAWVKVTEAQRQDCGRSPLHHHSAAHVLRLRRLFRAVEAHLQAQQSERSAAQAESARIEATARLLVRPPVSEERPDTEVFPTELLEISAQWQQDGQTYVQAVRQFLLHQQAATAGETPAEAPTVPDSDPREPHAAMVLQLARMVHHSHDAGLARRLRERFAFAPDAMRAWSREQGQCVSAVFWLGPDRMLARVGEPWQDDAHWVLLGGMAHTPLPALQGVGRSLNRECWAVCEEGRLTTRAQLDGHVLAHFPLPQGDEGIPPALGVGPGALARRCDQLIPFNDGQRVLLRNPTGIYLLTPSAVQRLHPQQWDEDGPYTWAKNRGGEGLSLDMLHMALSPDEQWVAVGDQDSQHLLLSAADGRIVQALEPLSSYPHHAAFHGGAGAPGAVLLANACHLYHGRTGAWPVHGARSAGTEDAADTPPEDDPAPAATLPEWRVYASTRLAASPLESVTVLGDAHGYLHAVDATLRSPWSHHVDGTLASLDSSPDGSVLVAGTCAGYLVVLERSEAGMDPFSIGTSPYAESYRWVFWSGETGPLRW